MITLKQEIRVREIISNPLDLSTDRYIAKTTGVSHWQVLYQRRLLNRAKKISLQKTTKIKKLLQAGFPQGAVETQCCATMEEVNCIRRFFYMKLRDPGDGGPLPCPTCGSMMFHKRGSGQVSVQANRKYLASSELTHISEGESLALYRLALDMSSLNDLRIIDNPMFYQLAKKAEKLLGVINDKKKNKPQ